MAKGQAVLIITMGPERTAWPHDDPDPLDRDRTGYAETMSPGAIYDANHGTWHLGAQAHRERYALFQHQREVKLAVEITSIDPSARDGRSIINGRTLTEGHPVHDNYVGKESPLPARRNPVGYYDAPEDATECLCGCGRTVPAGKTYYQGHDQTALHDRVRQIGTVEQFIDWFDEVHGYWPDVNIVFAYAGGGAPRMRHRLECVHIDQGQKARTATPEELRTLPVCKTCR
jgi:hypothetical protein